MKNMNWKLLSSEYLFKRPWLTARKDKVQLPDGRIMDEYYVLEYPTWINVIAITTEGQMVLVRQYRHGLGHLCRLLSVNCKRKQAMLGENGRKSCRFLPTLAR